MTGFRTHPEHTPCILRIYRHLAYEDTFRHTSREAMPGCGAVQAWVSEATDEDGAAGCGCARMMVAHAPQPLRDQTEASQGNTREEASGRAICLHRN